MDRRLSAVSQTQSIPFQDNGCHPNEVSIKSFYIKAGPLLEYRDCSAYHQPRHTLRQYPAVPCVVPMAVLPNANCGCYLLYNSDRGSGAPLQQLCQKRSNYGRSETKENILLWWLSYALDFAFCSASRSRARRQADCYEERKHGTSYFEAVFLQIHPSYRSRSTTGSNDLDLAQLYSRTPSAVLIQSYCQKSGPADLGSHTVPSFLFGVLWNPRRAIIWKLRVSLR